ncbi:hypothetical protein CY34DRAFT_402818 [Suillus luteus UH-Slu-Lm8-n1]|uniref:Uncharacterized protein n=1 Tax=Suillus luteus UH-Slu-Lm8-n1 TaxID=930992 RepID=A0A0C9ZLA3_9AGAM|nr:hypothetical protein CY34DRAFT_402818 [Suillus luteus UH-Slu-Lm8-n1]
MGTCNWVSLLDSFTTHFGKINEQQPIVLQCQVSESAPPFRHAHLLCHNLGFYLLLVFKWVIVKDSQGCLEIHISGKLLVRLDLAFPSSIVEVMVSKYSWRQFFFLDSNGMARRY